MRVTVVRPTELGETEAKLWAKFQQSAPATLSPFLSPTFARIVGEARPRARVAVVERDNTIEAFLPFELTSKRMAIPIGWPLNDLQGFITSRDPIHARSIIKKAGLRGWHFHHAPIEQQSLTAHSYLGTTTKDLVIDISDGYQAYFDGLGRSLRKNTIRAERALELQFGSVRFAWSDANPGRYLQKLVEWRSAKYNRHRHLFAADPTALWILEHLMSAKAEDCQGALNVLYADENPIAICTWLLGPRALNGLITSYDPDLARFSPGTLMLFSVAREAEKRGISRLDIGYGEKMSYKYRLANDSYDVFTGVVWASRAESAVRKLYRQVYYDRYRRNVAQHPVVLGQD